MIFLLVQLVVIGVLLYLLNTLVPMDQRIKTIINVIVILAVCLWLLEGFGLLSAPAWGHFPRVNK